MGNWRLYTRIFELTSLLVLWLLQIRPFPTFFNLSTKKQTESMLVKAKALNCLKKCPNALFKHGKNSLFCLMNIWNVRAQYPEYQFSGKKIEKLLFWVIICDVPMRQNLASFFEKNYRLLLLIQLFSKNDFHQMKINIKFNTIFLPEGIKKWWQCFASSLHSFCTNIICTIIFCLCWHYYFIRSAKQCTKTKIYVWIIIWKNETLWWDLDSGNAIGSFREIWVWLWRKANPISTFCQFWPMKVPIQARFCAICLSTIFLHIENRPLRPWWKKWSW